MPAWLEYLKEGSMPPIHPALVHFPVALAVTSVASDSAYLAGAPSELATVGIWCIGLAAAGAVVAAPAGYLDMKRDDLAHETHELVHLHMKAGIVLVGALLLLALWRWNLAAPSGWYVAAGWLAVAAIGLQAWFGGEIVYSHGGGVAAAGQGTTEPEKAKQPSRKLRRLLSGKEGGQKHEGSHHRSA